MNNPPVGKNLKLKDLLTDFCGNPTPFKTLARLDEETTVEETLKVFENSQSKRKVVEIKTQMGQILHLGYNELLTLLKNRNDRTGA